jgi:WhiB family redox-sensing transcriptional regulator
VTQETDWAAKGVCRSLDPDTLFVEGAAQNRAKAVCASCPVRTQCLAYALDFKIEHGVWEGLTERDRRALLRRRPNVTSWRDLLEAARAAHADLAQIHAPRNRRTAELVTLPHAS